MSIMQPFTSPYRVAYGTLMTDTIKGIIATQIPAARLAYNFPTDIDLTSGAQLLDANSPSADHAHNHAQVLGQQLFVDPMGVFTMSDEPSTDDPSVFDFVPGAASVMMRPTRSIEASQAVNAVIFTGACGRATCRGYAQDNDPSSLTYARRLGCSLLHTRRWCALGAGQPGREDHPKRVLGVAMFTLNII
jgi:hypothetical protein